MKMNSGDFQMKQPIYMQSVTPQSEKHLVFSNSDKEGKIGYTERLSLLLKSKMGSSLFKFQLKWIIKVGSYYIYICIDILTECVQEKVTY